MNCPRCGHHKTTAEPLTARNRDALSTLYRVRTCPKCLESFTTQEIPLDEAQRGEIILYGMLVSSTTSYESCNFRIRQDAPPQQTSDGFIQTSEKHSGRGEAGSFIWLCLWYFASIGWESPGGLSGCRSRTWPAIFPVPSGGCWRMGIHRME